MKSAAASASGSGKPATSRVRLMNRVLGVLAARYDYERFSREQGPDPFRILIGCLISLRTKDQVTFPATERLFLRADSPKRMVRLRKSTIVGFRTRWRRCSSFPASVARRRTWC